MLITLTNEDCMEMMKRYPDKHFDLAVVDPPYGIGQDWKKHHKGNSYKEISYTNDNIPTKKYFSELQRISHNQIIFGYNYFVEFLGPTNYLIVWDKCSNNNDIFQYSQAEIAYTSVHKPIQILQVPWDGYRMGKESGTKKIHPHQKPIELYSKILRKYARPGYKILDTHLGSGSSAIASYRLGLDITACEIDPYIFNAAKKRIDFEIKQQELFTVQEHIPEFIFEELKEASSI